MKIKRMVFILATIYVFNLIGLDYNVDQRYFESYTLIGMLKQINSDDTFPVVYSEEYIEDHNLPEKFIVYRNYGKAILHSINKKISELDFFSDDDFKQSVTIFKEIKRKNELQYGYGNLILSQSMEAFILKILLKNIIWNSISIETIMKTYLEDIDHIAVPEYWFRVIEKETRLQIFDYEKLKTIEKEREKNKYLGKKLRNLADNKKLYWPYDGLHLPSPSFLDNWDTRCLIIVIYQSKSIQFYYKFEIKILYEYKQKYKTFPEEHKIFKKQMKDILKKYRKKTILEEFQIGLWSIYCSDLLKSINKKTGGGYAVIP